MARHHCNEQGITVMAQRAGSEGAGMTVRRCNRRRRTITVLGLLMLMLGAGPAAATDDAELAAFKASIRALYDLKEAAFAADDAAPIVERFYAADARSVFANDAHSYAGTAAFRQEYEAIVPGAEVRVESVATHVSGDAGWDWANFHVMPDDPQAEDFSFIILFLWARENGEWRCKGDFYALGRLPVPWAAAQLPSAE
jgi:hypothetical protein